MKFLDLSLILTAVVMSALAQLILKLGMSAPPVAASIAQGTTAQVIATIATSPRIIAGLALYGLGAVVWLFVLAKQDLSLAYPFVGLGFIATMLLGIFVLGEHVTLSRVAGTLLIVAGCALVARTA